MSDIGEEFTQRLLKGAIEWPMFDHEVGVLKDGDRKEGRNGDLWEVFAVDNERKRYRMRYVGRVQ